MVLVAASGPATGGVMSPEAGRAYDLARAADDTAIAAHEEGTAVLKRFEELRPTGAESEPLRALDEEARAAHEALTGYRKQAQASASEAFQLVTELTRAAAEPTPDPIRREVFEQRAILAAHEAAVMAARARAEAERLRAVYAEARVLLAASRASTPGRPPAPAAGPAPGTASGAAGAAARPPGTEPSEREVTVPNLVGARLDAATRDLEAAGLRLGATTGPRDGFVVKQTPPAGSRAARRAAVGLTLSTTAAGMKPVTPR